MKQTEWVLCPVCGAKTRNNIREDTVLMNFPLSCPKCMQRKRPAAAETSKEIEDFILELQQRFTLPQRFSIEELAGQGAV